MTCRFDDAERYSPTAVTSSAGSGTSYENGSNLTSSLTSVLSNSPKVEQLKKDHLRRLKPS